ncbi:unnamed protein product, partial [Rotaria sp. Silwood2]
MNILLRHEEIRINIQDTQKWTPLHHSIMRNHIKMVKKLLDRDASIDVPDTQRATPSQYAYSFGNDAMIERFPLKPEWLNMKILDGKTPIDVAAEHGYHAAMNSYLNTPQTPIEKNHST